MSDSITVFDPRGHARVVAQESAPRPDDLDGLRPGVLENRKATTGSKPVAGPASRSTMATLTEECDFVVVGSSD